MQRYDFCVICPKAAKFPREIRGSLMKILHLLSQHQLAGAKVYAMTLAK